MRFGIILAALIGLATANPVLVDVVERDEKPGDGQVKVKHVSWNGSGCPQDPTSVVADVSGDGTIVALSFSKYIAQTGKGTKPGDARKNCNVRIILDYPDGLSYTVASTDLRGYASIPKGCSGKIGARYHFSGQREDATCNAVIKGKKEDYYTVTADVGALVWSKCGAKGPMFNANTQAVLDCHKDAYLGVDTQDTSFDTKFVMTWNMRWRKCKKH